MFFLTATTESFQLVTTNTNSLDVTTHFTDITATSFTPGSSQITINTAATTTVISAPSASTQRQLKMITIRNTGAGNNTVTLVKTISGGPTSYKMSPDWTIGPGEALEYSDLGGWGFVANASVQSVALTGPVTGSGTGTIATTITNQAVTYAKIQNTSTDQVVIGRNAGGAGTPQEVTATQVLDWLGNVQGSLLYRGASGWAALTPTSANFEVLSGGPGANPQWANPYARILAQQMIGPYMG
jgi:hypothetical protein